MEDSILNSIKKALGPDDSDTVFDSDLIMFINSVFSILFQLGVGPKDAPYRITGVQNVWSEFLDEDQLDMVRTYVFMKVKLVFDPPASSFVLASYKEQIQEFEWRANVAAETP